MLKSLPNIPMHSAMQMMLHRARPNRLSVGPMEEAHDAQSLAGKQRSIFALVSTDVDAEPCGLRPFGGRRLVERDY